VLNSEGRELFFYSLAKLTMKHCNFNTGVLKMVLSSSKFQTNGISLKNFSQTGPALHKTRISQENDT
jgi:hypothetical protein